MVFITHTRSPQFRQELRRHGVGVTWQFIRKEAQGWDRSKRCEEQSNGQAYAVQRNPQKTGQRNQRGHQPRARAPGAGRASANWQRHSSRASADVVAAPYTP